MPRLDPDVVVLDISMPGLNGFQTAEELKRFGSRAKIVFLTNTFISEYVKAIHDQNAAVFAGAGLSIPAGVVNWKGLLRDIARDVGLDVDRETDLVAVAQYHLNEQGSRHKINQALVTEFSARARSNEEPRDSRVATDPDVLDHQLRHAS